MRPLPQLACGHSALPAPYAVAGATGSNGSFEAFFGAACSRLGLVGIQAPQDFRTVLDQHGPLYGVIFFRDLVQIVIKIQLLQGVQDTIAFGQQSGTLVVFLAFSLEGRVRSLFQKMAG